MAKKDDAGANEIKVRIGSFPGGRMVTHGFTPGITVAEALKQAEVPVDASLDVRVNGQTVSSMEATLSHEDQVMIFKKVRGN